MGGAGQDRPGLTLNKKANRPRGQRKNSSHVHTQSLDASYNFSQHSTEVDEGQSSKRLVSIVDQSDLADFLQVASLANIDFAAEKVSSVMVSDAPRRMETEKPTLPSEALRIPRRPSYRSSTSAKEFQMLEEKFFLEWRRNIAAKENSGHFIMTPFERNIEIWRQLWRVVDSCNVMVQIVDARNPLLFYCSDLDQYVKECDSRKEMILLINKADFLSSEQRRIWSEHLYSLGIDHLFYSALEAQAEDSIPQITDAGERWCILSNSELLAYLRERSCGLKVGMAGYPNVGKSSTINSLIGTKKVSVAATPGKTKHFQTIVVDEKLTLCDCPGLVFPNFAASRAELVLAGVLPVDELREWNSSIELLIQRIPIRTLQRLYKLKGDSTPTASELLSTFAAARGFSTAYHGSPDESRAARIILKDYVSGKLNYCVAPPGVEDFMALALTNPDLDEISFKAKKNPFKPQAPEIDEFLIADKSLTGTAHVSFTPGTRNWSSQEGLQQPSKKHYKGR